MSHDENHIHDETVSNETCVDFISTGNVLIGHEEHYCCMPREHFGPHKCGACPYEW